MTVAAPPEAAVPKRPAASATIKIDPELLRRAKKVAALKEVKLQDYLDKLLRGPINRDFARVMPTDKAD